MGRLLGEGVKYILKIKDPVSSGEIVLFYRMPTNKEKIGYWGDLWDRKEKKLLDNLTSARVKWGSVILEGFGEGSFEHRVDGDIRPLSSDMGSADFFPAWKEWVIQYASDLVETLAIHVFDGFDMEASQEEPPEKK